MYKRQVINLENAEKTDIGLWDRAIHDAVITSFEDADNGNILIGTSNHGILIYDSSLNAVRKAMDKSARECKVESILENNYSDYYGEDTFIIGLENGGIKLFSTKEEKLIDITIPGVAFDFSTWKVHDLMEDSQGNIWVGAFHTGLMVIPKSMYGFESVDLGDRGYLGTAGVCAVSYTHLTLPTMAVV